MKRIVIAAACTMTAILLLHGDASAFGRRAVGYATTSYYGATYAGIPIVTYGGVGPMYSYAPSYGYAPAQIYTPGYGYGAYGVYGYGGYRGYNPGGLGGPWSGLGVRPGVGLGGFGVRR